MKNFFCLCICYFFVPIAIPAAPTADERYNFFNIDLLQAVNEEINGNVIISPASAKIALMALIEGTSKRTRQELLTTLRLPPNLSIVRAVSERALTPLKSFVNGTEIDVNTCVWMKTGINISRQYSDVLQRYYGANLHSVDFSNVDNAVATINNWGRQATRNKIDAIVDSGSIQSDTLALLTSALYFKGQWAKAFDRKATQPRCFHTPNRSCQNVNLMENLAHYRYGYISSLDADVVEIPYSNGQTSMLVLLPSHEESDPNLLILSKDLSYVPMSTLLSNLQETELILQIPRFSIETKLDLKTPLKRLGIHDLFDSTISLSEILPNDTLRVGNILQNAKIEVDEEGTVAAAVTTVSIIPLMGSSTPTFRANRPFLFVIVDLQTNGTLFAGRFMQPNPSDPIITKI